MHNAIFLGLIDIPNERSSHSKVTPRGAGISFGFAFFISILLFDFSLFIEYWFLFLSIFMVFLVGILDDHKDASPKAKFYVIFLATFLLFLNDINIYSLGSFFGFEINLWYLSLPFTIFALAGFTNALNLIDGLDGLAASISIISLEYIHPIAIFYLAALPIVDTLVVMIRRIRKGISPFTPDKTHVYHILLNFFAKKVRKTVFFLILTRVLFSLVGIMLSLNSYEVGQSPASFVASIAFMGIIILIYMVFTGIKRREKLVEKLANRRKIKLNKQKIPNK